MSRPPGEKESISCCCDKTLEQGNLKKGRGEAAEEALWLGALVALAKGPSSVPSTTWQLTTIITPVPEDSTPFSNQALDIHMIHIQACRDNTHTHNMK